MKKNTFLFILFICILNSCKKSADTNPAYQPINVSGNLKKLSYSIIPGKATVNVYEKDNQGRLINIKTYDEDSVAPINSKLTGKYEFFYQGNLESPSGYLLLFANTTNILDTLFQIFNYYNTSSQIIHDSSLWIYYHQRNLKIITDFSYQGNWIVTTRKDYRNFPGLVDTIVFIDSISRINNNIVYHAFYHFNTNTSTTTFSNSVRTEFDDKINPLGKFNIAKYLYNPYGFRLVSAKNPILEKYRTFIGGINDAYELKYVYTYSDNNYPMSAFVYKISGNTEQLFQVIKYIYE